MVLINKALNEITVKLVYYGPGLCGKTTNLEKIYGNPKLEHKGKMISMSTETDRTLFFDFMPMELGTIAGQKVRVQLYTVPGQVFYDATRKLVLRGADGVVFVADSQSTMRDSNVDSFENLKTNLRINRIDPEKVALVLQYNKRDLPNVDSVDEMNAYLNPFGVPAVEASAITGSGVTATLRAAVTRILDNLKKNVDTTLHDEPELTAPDMSAKSGVTSMSAGTPKLSMKTTASSPEAPPFAPPPFDAEETMTVSPFEPQTYEPEPYDGVAVAEEEDPFGAMAAVEPQPDQAGDPFGENATAIHDAGAERAELETLLDSASAVVRALESALDQARAHESALRTKLG
jgi:signal recognition particle receptor subunit beta